MRDQVEFLNTCINCIHNKGRLETVDGAFYKCQGGKVEDLVRSYESCFNFKSNREDVTESLVRMMGSPAP